MPGFMACMLGDMACKPGLIDAAAPAATPIPRCMPGFTEVAPNGAASACDQALSQKSNISHINMFNARQYLHRSRHSTKLLNTCCICKTVNGHMSMTGSRLVWQSLAKHKV